LTIASLSQGHHCDNQSRVFTRRSPAQVGIEGIRDGPWSIIFLNV
jgi:hypothetical protein